MSEIMTGISQTIARVPGRFQPYLTPVVEVKLLCSRLRPERQHEGDAGADLRSFADHEIYPGELKLVDTGVSIKIPLGYMGLVLPRSSMGKVRVSLANTAGIIDFGYMDSVKLLLVNEGEEPFIIQAMDTRIAQLIIVPVMLAKFTDFEDNWLDTDRGEGGFGSTGK